MECLVKIKSDTDSNIKKNDILKALGILFMLIDHIGVKFFPKVILLRAIGRLSFPIFAYGIVKGYHYTKNIKLYVLRLFLFFLISQPFYIMVFNKGLNIFATLLVGLILIYFYDKKQYINMVILIVMTQSFSISYGLYGLGIIFTFHIFKNDKKSLVFSQILINLIFALQNHTFLQACSLLSLMLIYIEEWPIKINISKYVWYLFYPIHLCLILLIVYII